MREDTVDVTKDVKLDTTLRAPDGYELQYDVNRGHGLLTDIFWSSSSYEPRLRKGASSVGSGPGTVAPPSTAAASSHRLGRRHEMSDKQDALIEVVDLITRHGLTIDEVSAALKGEPAFKAARSGGILSRLFAYIGGTFVIVGVAI